MVVGQGALMLMDVTFNEAENLYKLLNNSSNASHSIFQLIKFKSGTFEHKKKAELLCGIISEINTLLIPFEYLGDFDENEDYEDFKHSIDGMFECYSNFFTMLGSPEILNELKKTSKMEPSIINDWIQISKTELQKIYRQRMSDYKGFDREFISNLVIKNSFDTRDPGLTLRYIAFTSGFKDKYGPLIKKMANTACKYPRNS